MNNTEDSQIETRDKKPGQGGPQGPKRDYEKAKTNEKVRFTSTPPKK